MLHTTKVANGVTVFAGAILNVVDVGYFWSLPQMVYVGLFLENINRKMIYLYFLGTSTGRGYRSISWECQQVEDICLFLGNVNR